MAKISVLGSGSWGMALALLLYNNGHEVLLWSARPEDARKLREKRENPDRLPGVQIPEDIEILIDLERAIKSTLRENGLKVLEEVCPLSARMVVNQVSMKMEDERIRKLITELRNVVK